MGDDCVPHTLVIIIFGFLAKWEFALSSNYIWTRMTIYNLYYINYIICNSSLYIND